MTLVDLDSRRRDPARDGMLRLRDFKEAQERYARAKEKRDALPRQSRVGSPESRECLRASEAIRDAQRAVWEAFGAWEEAERSMLPLGADHGG